VVASYGVMFKPSFVAISHQIQNLKRTQKDIRDGNAISHADFSTFYGRKYD